LRTTLAISPAILAPVSSVLDDPVQQRPLEADVVARLLAFEPLVGAESPPVSAKNSRYRAEFITTSFDFGVGIAPDHLISIVTTVSPVG